MQRAHGRHHGDAQAIAPPVADLRAKGGNAVDDERPAHALSLPVVGRKDMARAGECPASHLRCIACGGMRDHAAQIGIFLDEFRHPVDGQADHVVDDQDLAVAVAAGADADGWNGDAPGEVGGDGLDRAFDDHRKRAGLFDRVARRANRAATFSSRAALDPVAAVLLHRLRQQADMSHHRNAGGDDGRDLPGHVDAAFQLHRLAAGFVDDPPRRGNGLRRRILIAAGRHVDDDAGLGRAAHHRLPMRDHHLERGAERRLVAMQHHGDAVADQEQVDMVVEQAGDGIGVGGQADDRHAALAAANRLGADPDVGGRTSLGPIFTSLSLQSVGYRHWARRALERRSRLGKRACSQLRKDRQACVGFRHAICAAPRQNSCLRDGLTP